MTARALRKTLPFLLATLHATAAAQGGVDQPIQAAQVFGRTTSARGRPLGGVVLSLVPLDQGEPARPITAMARYDGAIPFSDVPRGGYRFLVPGGAFTILPATVDCRVGGNIQLGDIVVQPDVTSDLKQAQILVDPRLIQNGPPKGTMKPIEVPRIPSSGFAQLDSAASFERYQTVEAFLGGKVRTIRVVDVRAFPGRSHSDAAEIQSRIMEVWLGVFRHADGALPWSEPNCWNLSATVEFVDGSHAAIMTDGTHVQVVDREGRSWFIRLWPSVG